jgi:hypothetical protein
MAQQVIQGTWEEIASQADKFAGRRLLVMVLDGQPAEAVGGGGDEDPDALDRAVAAMVGRTPQERAAAQARAAAEFRPANEPPPGQTVLDAVFGRWPGDETDEEVRLALERLS